MKQIKRTLHFQSGKSYSGKPYSLCTYSTKVYTTHKLNFVNCKNCLKKIEVQKFKKQLRNKAENDITILAKSMNKNNIIQITRACNQIWSEYENKR